MAVVYIPASLERLFPGIQRRLEVDGSTVDTVIRAVDARYPGFRDRVCEPARVRQHINVFVDGERATLETELAGTSEVRIIPAVSGGGLDVPGEATDLPHCRQE